MKTATSIDECFVRLSSEKNMMDFSYFKKWTSSLKLSLALYVFKKFSKNYTQYISIIKGVAFIFYYYKYMGKLQPECHRISLFFV